MVWYISKAMDFSLDHRLSITSVLMVLDRYDETCMHAFTVFTRP